MDMVGAAWRSGRSPEGDWSFSTPLRRSSGRQGRHLQLTGGVVTSQELTLVADAEGVIEKSVHQDRTADVVGALAGAREL